MTAKAVASLDHLSGGRFVFGVGFGWNADEIEDHGVEMRSRRAVAREHVLAMQRLWADDVAGFEGEHVHLPPSWSWPKPKQKPWPPVLVGGAAGPKLFAHVAEYADGWIPIGGAGVREALPQLHRAVEAAGRDPAAVRVVPFGTIPDPGKLDHYASIGIDEVVLPRAGRRPRRRGAGARRLLEAGRGVSATDRVRIGTLGAARIAPGALIKPARGVAEAEVVAVAARDPARAEKFARKHKIPKVHATTRTSSPTPESMRSTTRCRTACTPSGR